MQLVRTDVAEIGYLEYGDPAGVPVLLVHGFPDDAHSWDAVARHLQKDRLRLIAPFLRGFGPSRVTSAEAFSGQTAALAQDIFDLADGLGIHRFLLVGHDWGARAAYAAAALEPQRLLGLVALSSPYTMSSAESDSPAQAQAYWYQWYFNTECGQRAFAEQPVRFARSLWRAWSPGWAFHAAALNAASAAWSNPQFAGIALHSYRHRHGTDPGKPIYEARQQVLDARPLISVPTHFACGTGDACNLRESSLSQEQFFAGGYYRTELATIGHFPQREVPAAVARLIRLALR